jgi:maltooligosyltrehalose trehalohydrolase
MGPVGRGYFHVKVEELEPGARYLYRLDDERERPDPASRAQPDGVHGPSEVQTAGFEWRSPGWSGLPLQAYVFYEVHVGTFTEQGTFDAIIPRLPELAELGITALELMPVAAFPGDRNWGYDGVYPFAAQNSYGGADGLRRLVDASHGAGLAVVLDVVHNHLGPEGNYLSDFGPYFTDRYSTPWGRALNFDGPHSDDVRHFFIENALYWVTECRVDALRLDAVHAIPDSSPVPFLSELAEAVHARADRLNRRIFLIPESAANDARILRRQELGGYGLDAQWNDDFHHALHVLLTGERSGYYEDYGHLQQMATAFRQGYVYAGSYSPYHRRRRGSSPHGIDGKQFVVFSQNHDQIGNRALGERLSGLVSFEHLKLAASAVLLAPFLPLLFMGEEYGETAPFQYFVSHSDPALVESVRHGRRGEFAAFGWGGEIPDPQDYETFLRSRLNWQLRAQGRHRLLLRFYRALLQFRRTIPAIGLPATNRSEILAFDGDRVLYLRRWWEEQQIAAAMNFCETAVTATLPVPAGRWRKILDSAEEKWGGSGSPAPESVVSEGKASFDLPGTACVVFVLELEE